MNRAIKFRAWDIEDKLMIWPDVLFFDNHGTCDGLQDPVRSVMLAVPERAILMSFTGLRDRNEIELYDGDILKTFDSFQMFINRRVIWDNKHALWTLETETGEYGDLYEWTRASEVIGNIYEHPELLEGEK